jgi:hypothetical protein
MLTVEIKDEKGNIVGIMTLDPKIFSTGSVGFHGSGKVAVAGEKYQANFMLIKIGSKLRG